MTHHASHRAPASPFLAAASAAVLTIANASGAAPAETQRPAPTASAPTAPAAAGPETSRIVSEAVPVAGGEGGVGFDDLRFAPRLGKVLVPAGRTGNLVLLDPATREMTPIGGFTTSAEPKAGHGQGTTSADEGDGLLFATDRGSSELVVVDAKTRTISGRAKLAASPDYVRVVPGRREVWVTEPDADQIEVFTLPAEGAPKHAALIPVKGGPEALIFESSGKRAFTHLWKGQSVAIDVASRSVSAPFRNGCEGSRGVALDEANGILLVGCAEGSVVALRTSEGHEILDTAKTGAGVDIVDFDAKLRHVYAPGGKSATLTILGVSPAGKLGVLTTWPAASRSHCVVSGGGGHVFVCDPGKGALLAYTDTLPATR